MAEVPAQLEGFLQRLDESNTGTRCAGTICPKGFLMTLRNRPQIEIDRGDRAEGPNRRLVFWQRIWLLPAEVRACAAKTARWTSSLHQHIAGAGALRIRKYGGTYINMNYIETAQLGARDHTSLAHVADQRPRTIRCANRRQADELN